MTTYTCRGCSRTVDADLEPSPGEPTYCPDCLADRERDDRIEDELLRRALQTWGQDL